MNVYKPNEIESKWQKTWEKNEQYKTDTNDNTKPNCSLMSAIFSIVHLSGCIPCFIAAFSAGSPN